MGEFLTITEIAENLRVSDRTVRNWIEKGSLKAYRFGLSYRVTKESFEKFVQESQVNIEEKGE